MANDAQMPELLPCPFCGGEAKVYGPVGWYRQYGISHSCRVFYGGSGDFTLGAKTEEEAIAQWNRRDLCASGQQVRALALLEAARFIETMEQVDPPEPMTADMLKAVAGAGLREMAKRLAALTPAPQPDAEHCGCGDKACLACFPSTTPPAQEAEPVDVRKCQTCHGFGWIKNALDKCPDCAIPPACQQEAVPVAWWDAIAPALTFPADWRDQAGSLNKQRIWANGFQTCREQVSVRIGELEGYAHPPQPSETVAEALKPFANMINHIETDTPDDYHPSWAEFLTVGDFRRAAAALRALKGGFENE